MTQDLIPPEPGRRRRTERGMRVLLALVVLSFQVLPVPGSRFAAAQNAAPGTRDPALLPPAAAPEAAPDAAKSETSPPAGAQDKPATADAVRPSTSEAICLLVES